ncbi:hypothetical protein [Natronobacterium gregoryi]|uniref:Solute carrier family 6, member 8 n=2 Tax=Natronobacterium gregoryi TaxID=44930 RepID=L0AIW1_NATGS|nr:hypothetical protein [Natronobacterium gregoryi]AFZ73005.1 hypothetical protein Natgr_1814 [Natronobacterium gregoryi SP2]ELY70120.1 solute carrier family 6, member 8 [Natronobacterium gregoryi SP2]PLK18058.1 hypothetical protein CYV19_18755 [Natronobacterium gregoryi SP2]SFJ74564.1 hypothetical protein SAMN05443661_1732 [Natronobacterium gregoryi]
MTGSTDSSSANTSRNDSARRIISALRLVAVALVIVGFVGWASGDAAPFDLESPYTIAFGVGVACAFASIYLGIFLAEGGEE